MAKEYELNGKIYHLHYSVSRLEQIEKVCGCSVVSVMSNIGNNNLPPISVLKHIFAYGLMEENGVYAPMAAAVQFADEELERSGYITMVNAVMEQIVEDCGFLFRNV